MRILTILTYYRPHWTGLTMIAQRIAEGMARRGHDVTVLTTQHHPELPRDEVVAHVRVVRLKQIARLSRAVQATDDEARATACADQMARRQPEREH